MRVSANKSWLPFMPGKHLLAVVLLVTPFIVDVSCEAAISLEYKVKAAYIFKLINFVEWEKHHNSLNKGDNVNICIIGKHPINEAVQLLGSKKVKSQTVKVIPKVIADELTECHIVFMTRSVKDRMQEVLFKVDPDKNLTISDIPGFAKKGGMVELATIDNKVKLVINRNKVNASKIQFSSKLMNVSVLVYGGEKGGGVR
ncbi:MAG: YfiR family protein [Gammaproteobacteria bacterium]|jgi:hypothetical protein